MILNNHTLKMALSIKCHFFCVFLAVPNLFLENQLCIFHEKEEKVAEFFGRIAQKVAYYRFFSVILVKQNKKRFLYFCFFS